MGGIREDPQSATQAFLEFEHCFAQLSEREQRLRVLSNVSRLIVTSIGAQCRSVFRTLCEKL